MDEIQALEKALELAKQRGIADLPLIWWHLEKGVWQISLEMDSTFRFSALDGRRLHEVGDLDAVSAYRIARQHAEREGHRWEPAFTISRGIGEWRVGAKQAQLGGQMEVFVTDDGSVRSLLVNPR